MATENTLPRKLWQHPRPESTDMYAFMKAAERSSGKTFNDYAALYDWSCNNISDFWRFSWDYFPIVFTGKVPSSVVDENARIDSIPKWFQGVKLNFAENILYVGNRDGRKIVSPGKEDWEFACTEVREGAFREPIRQTTWKELRERVGRLSQAMRAHGVRKGDTIAAVASTCLDTLCVFLATTTIGAIFTSSSTDMGTKGVLDRLTQSKPKYLFMEDWAVYKGKKIDLRPKMKQIVEGMVHVHEFRGVVMQPRFQNKPTRAASVPRCQTLAKFLEKAPTTTLDFEQLDFAAPMITLYSSGTTGQPKCIVHSVGGVVLSGHKESRLQRSVGHTSTQLQFTTTAWMMYMSAVQLLLVGARTVMYDGSPFEPDMHMFLRLVSHEKVTHLGISPRYLQTLQESKISPREVTDLSNLKVVTSTGMVLSDALFNWFYDVGFPPSVQLANIPGGTDIAAAFGTSNPILPLYVGGCQCIALGMAVSVFDGTIEGGVGVKGKPVKIGTAGELVCTRPFPTMPAKFIGDVDGKRYFSSYFEKFDNTWTHGDFVRIHPTTKQILMLGRADGVLNPSGVRFGSSDIYSVIDAHFSDRVADSICVGQRRSQDNDESVMLFLLMKPGKSFTRGLVEDVKQAIRQAHSARHVPKYVFETPEIPVSWMARLFLWICELTGLETTVNQKKVELPVKQIVSGKIIKPSETLANPKCLDFYYQFARDKNLVAESRPRL